MSEMPRGGMPPEDLYEDEFFIVTEDEEEQMVNVAFVERSLVMRFDYEEFLDFFKALEEVRGRLEKRLRPARS